MTKPVHFHKLNVSYTAEDLDDVHAEIQEIQDFIAYYEVQASMLKRQAKQVHLEELELLSVYYNPEKTKIPFEELIFGDKEPEYDLEQLTLNLSGILKSMPGGKEDFTLAYLHKIQVALHHLLLQQAAGVGLRMDTDSLFAASIDPHQDILEKDTKVWLDELLKMSNSKEMPAPVKAWYFYYYFNVLKPFESNNELLAYIVCKNLLIAGGYDFFLTLNPERFVFRDKAVVVLYDQLSGADDMEKRLQADLQDFCKTCHIGLLNNIMQTKDAVTQVVRDQLDYQTLTPRQKNSLNFWLEKAFFLHKDKLGQLSPRQHEMMLLIAKYGSLSNKDLVPVFMVDRKTIQRDFNALLDMKLLDQRGGGRALKYYINLRVPLED